LEPDRVGTRKVQNQKVRNQIGSEPERFKIRKVRYLIGSVSLMDTTKSELSEVFDTAESKLGSDIDTAKSKHCGIVDTAKSDSEDTAESN
jgi:hypothetical protein